MSSLYGVVIEPTDITAGSNHTGVERFAGFSVREDASAAAVINFRHGSVSGQILATLTLSADESATIFFGGHHPSSDGVYVEEVSGSITGVLYNLA